MASEIERKFLVQGDGWRAGARQRLCQCYLNRDAEIELQSEDQPFSRPPWLGKEVTNDNRYYNSNLAGHPYKAWRNDTIAG
jgi:CYTH domain-containing protein